MVRISVVTACFNAVQFIDATVQSVLSQEYCDLEYIVVDGGSTDGTVEALAKYRDRFAYFESQRDEGQYFAIQKGLERCTGDVVAWLNADDVYFPWTLAVVRDIFANASSVDWIVGRPSFINVGGQLTRCDNAAVYPQDWIANGWYRQGFAGYLQQESMFWRKSLMAKVGALRTELTLAADFDYWTRFARHAALHGVTIPLAAFRQLPGVQRSSVHSVEYGAEVAKITSEMRPPPWWWRAVRWIRPELGQASTMAMRKRGPLVGYSREAGWHPVETSGPIARKTMVQHMTEHNGSRQQ